MNRQADLDRVLEDWFAEGPSQLSDRAIQSIVRQLDQRQHRRHWWLPGRQQMNRLVFGLSGAVAVVVVAALALGIYVNNPGSGVGGPGAAPTASPAPTTGPSPTTEPTAPPEPTATPRPTGTPDAGLPEGPFGIEPDGAFSNEDSGMALTVTIPSSGWKFDRTWALLDKSTEVDNDASATIAFWAFPGQEFYVPADACRMTSTRPDTPATTADELAAALAARTPPDVSEPVDVTVGGYEGKFITLHVPEDVPNDCEQGDFVYYVTSPDDFWRNSQNPGQVEELWILDVDGTIVIINALHPLDSAPETVEELRAIAESTQFEVP